MLHDAAQEFLQVQFLSVFVGADVFAFLTQQEHLLTHLLTKECNLLTGPLVRHSLTLLATSVADGLLLDLWLVLRGRQRHNRKGCGMLAVFSTGVRLRLVAPNNCRCVNE